jgi:hypothetical protein
MVKARALSQVVPHNDVIAAGFEGGLDMKDLLENIGSMPVVAVLEEWCRPPFYHWKCGDEIFGAHGFGWNSVFRWTTGGSGTFVSLR